MKKLVDYTSDAQEIADQVARGKKLINDALNTAQVRLAYLKEGNVESKWGAGREIHFLEKWIEEWTK